MGLPTYRSVTRVELRDGCTTSFWQDRWFPGCALCFQFEALFSHSTRPNATVADVLHGGISLQPRLSAVAARELEEVHEILRSVHHSSTPDRRIMAWGPDTRFSSRAVYRVLSLHGCIDLASSEIWASRLPSKIKVFARLLTVGCLSTRVNLHAKSCSPTPSCESRGADETTDHLFITCRRAAEVWERLNMSPLRCVSEVLSSAPPESVSSSCWRDGLFVLLWQV